MKKHILSLLFIAIPLFLYASGSISTNILGIPSEFILFAFTLLAVAIFHEETMLVALFGLSLILIVKFIGTPDFSMYHHIFGDGNHEGEWKIIINLVGLLLGFGILAKLFEESNIPFLLPNYLPNDWKGGLVLLILIMILSSFLDNIAAAMIGGTIAAIVFNNKVHIGYLAAIIGASNAGGAGSVIGDTTTTIMWIDGVSPLWVLNAFIASIAAFLFFGVIASKQQFKFQPIQKDATPGIKLKYSNLLVVFLILVGAIVSNYTLDLPAVGVWVAIIIGAFLIKIPWVEIKHTYKGAIFLTALVLCASLMPVEDLPPASWQTAFALGFVSSIFDNIPLTKLCLEQGNYDWGLLAYAVGFGGSMLWFGSSAGVALSSVFPESRSTLKYLRYGWHIIIAYVIGFFTLYLLLGWHPIKLN